MSIPITDFCAVVPAHNEQDLVGRALLHLIAATDHAKRTHSGIRIRTVLVADSCTDDTATIAMRIPGVNVLRLDAATVGAARAEGVAFALSAFRQQFGHMPSGEAGWIGNTDADSAVPPQWITEQLNLAEQGVDVMVGTVRPDFADLTPAQIAAWTAKRIPGKPNGHVHGANLGIRVSAYSQVGGFYRQMEHEDNDIVQRLRETGACIVASDSCEVLTSGRQVGRTPGGYAGYLAHDLIPRVSTESSVRSDERTASTGHGVVPSEAHST